MEQAVQGRVLVNKSGVPLSLASFTTFFKFYQLYIPFPPTPPPKKKETLYKSGFTLALTVSPFFPRNLVFPRRLEVLVERKCHV